MRISDWSSDVCSSDLGGGPNGLAIGPDGKLYCCNNGGFGWVEADGLLIPHGTAADYAGGSIQRIDIASGAVETLYTEAARAPLCGPNDIDFEPHGGFWLTHQLGRASCWVRVCQLV